MGWSWLTFTEKVILEQGRGRGKWVSQVHGQGKNNSSWESLEGP